LIKTDDNGIGTRPEPFDSFAPAMQALNWTMRDVLPQIALEGTLKAKSQPWQSQRTLLNSTGNANDFVVEVDDDGDAQLRFGDDEHGERPDGGTAFTGTYRIGNGAAGNVGAESIVHFIASGGDLPNVLSVRNPLAAQGGVDPEDAATVRRNAPEAFRTPERAVTTDDYAVVTERNRNVQRAAVTLRWTGSWYTVFDTVDPVVGADADELKADLAPFVDRYRMAGHDLEFNDPHYVSLEIELHVCVKDGYFRSNVKNSLLQVLGNRLLPDGRRGLFHPDNFTFGQSVLLSPLYAAAHQVAGVTSVQITKLQRQGTDDPTYLMNGELPLGRLEIARLDNDPNFPEHGVLRLDIHGGR
jgi:predicted phage baseplate assembly protein